MIAIGIPTFNESENIATLVKEIDRIALELEEEILIINSDNNSEDKTSEIFKKIETKANKISLLTNKRGKGRNIKKILENVSQTSNCIGCILIDGDIKSLERQWLVKYMSSLKEGYDYVLPSYKRNFQEGNTTNHFVYPLLSMKVGESCPKQPIAGDFGLSKKYINYLISEAKWHEFTNGYGIDVFLSLHALHGKFKVHERSLGSKIHNPSFNKMNSMFIEVAASYYETMGSLSGEFSGEIVIEESDYSFFNPKTRINQADIELKKNDLKKYIDLNTTVLSLNNFHEINDEKWGEILFEFEKMITRKNSLDIANKLFPFFLSRVINYLEHSKNSNEALIKVYNARNHLIHKNKYKSIKNK